MPVLTFNGVLWAWSVERYGYFKRIALRMCNSCDKLPTAMQLPCLQIGTTGVLLTSLAHNNIHRVPDKCASKSACARFGSIGLSLTWFLQK